MIRHLQDMVVVPDDMVEGVPTTWSKGVVENIVENIKYVVGHMV